MPVTSATILRRLRQEVNKFEATLGNLVTPCLFFLFLIVVSFVFVTSFFVVVFKFLFLLVQ